MKQTKKKNPLRLGSLIHHTIQISISSSCHNSLLFYLIPGPFTVFVPLDQAFEVLIQRFGGLEVASEQFAKDPEVLTSVSYLIFFLLLKVQYMY